MNPIDDGIDRPEQEDRPELIKQRARAILFERLWRLSLYLLIGAVGGLVVLDILVGHSTRDDIADCTIPGGECYQRSQEQTGEAIGQLINEEILTRTYARLAASCADKAGVQTEDDIEKCILRDLKEEVDQ